MTWRDGLLPASFRGVRFEVDSHDSRVGGRRIALHEYPGRDRPWAEDLGKRADGFDIAAYVIGDDYMARRDALIRACAEAGPGALVHPYLGERSVMCEACRVSERTDAGRMATFELRFVESGRAEYPSPSPDTAAVVKGSADAARAASIARFVEAWQP